MKMNAQRLPAMYLQCKRQGSALQSVRRAQRWLASTGKNAALIELWQSNACNNASDSVRLFTIVPHPLHWPKLLHCCSWCWQRMPHSGPMTMTEAVHVHCLPSLHIHIHCLPSLHMTEVALGTFELWHSLHTCRSRSRHRRRPTRRRPTHPPSKAQVWRMGHLGNMSTHRPPSKPGLARCVAHLHIAAEAAPAGGAPVEDTYSGTSGQLLGQPATRSASLIAMLSVPSRGHPTETPPLAFAVRGWTFSGSAPTT